MRQRKRGLKWEGFSQWGPYGILLVLELEPSAGTRSERGSLCPANLPSTHLSPTLG